MTEIEFRRQQRGLSQYELASMIGRSQGQLANALRGHDPIAKASTGCLLYRLKNENESCAPFPPSPRRDFGVRRPVELQTRWPRHRKALALTLRALDAASFRPGCDDAAFLR